MIGAKLKIGHFSPQLVRVQFASWVSVDLQLKVGLFDEALPEGIFGSQHDRSTATFVRNVWASKRSFFSPWIPSAINNFYALSWLGKFQRMSWCNWLASAFASTAKAFKVKMARRQGTQRLQSTCARSWVARDKLHWRKVNQARGGFEQTRSSRSSQQQVGPHLAQVTTFCLCCWSLWAAHSSLSQSVSSVLVEPAWEPEIQCDEVSQAFVSPVKGSLDKTLEFQVVQEDPLAFFLLFSSFVCYILPDNET